jgi:hypothetical protein
LDDRVVEVAGDALPVFEPPEPVSVVTAASELDREGRLAGERLDHANLALVEGRATLRPANPEHAESRVLARKGEVDDLSGV